MSKAIDYKPDVDFLKSIGFRREDGNYVLRPKSQSGHLRHTNIAWCEDANLWRVNGLGIDGPETKLDLECLIALVFD